MADQRESEERVRKSRKDIDVPIWVSCLMALPFGLLLIGLTLVHATGSNWWMGLIVLSILGTKIAVYRIYRRQHPADADVAFYNKSDGYFVGGDYD